MTGLVGVNDIPPLLNLYILRVMFRGQWQLQEDGTDYVYGANNWQNDAQNQDGGQWVATNHCIAIKTPY